MTELLAPAGNLEKLKIAYSYGADAVYIAGQQFGLRSGADNFSPEEIKAAATFAHERGKKLYITLNAFLHDDELAILPEFAQFLDEVGIDAVICSDLGVVQTVRKSSNLDIHVSTQASVLNSHYAQIWKEMGATRIVVGRELSVEETAKIKKIAGIEVEMFVHGAMCMAYSGHCTISNYTAGRDSNRGGCIQSCRFSYKISNAEGKSFDSYFMSSKDLQGITNLPYFVHSQIDSLKIEGRMKSNLYVASTTRIYAQALKKIKAGENFSPTEFLKELKKIPHRDYTSASLASPAQRDSIYEDHNEGTCEYMMAGTVLEIDHATKRFALHTRNRLEVGMELEILPFSEGFIKISIDLMEDIQGNSRELVQGNSIIWLPWQEGIAPQNVARTRGKIKNSIIPSNSEKQKSLSHEV